MNAQLCSPVRWSQTLQTLAGEGFTTFVELGPGSVLSGLVKRSLEGASRLTVNTPDHLDTLLDALVAPPDDGGESHEGEHLFATDRMVVSPCAGVFTPVPGLEAGHQVAAGALLGHIGTEEVHSPFAGELMGWLAVETERVSSSKPIAWLRAT
jgi:[acyl-carrier-protein] S-malonyltransferase